MVSRARLTGLTIPFCGAFPFFPFFREITKIEINLSFRLIAFAALFITVTNEFSWMLLGLHIYNVFIFLQSFYLFDL